MTECSNFTSQYLENCLYFTSNAMARLLNKMTEDAFKPTGLSPSYAFLMMTVIENETVGTGELARLLKLKPSTITRFVDKLVFQGYLERTQEGRNVNVKATPAGEALLPSIHSAWTRLYETYCSVLGKDFAVQLTQNMAKAAKILENQ